MKNGLIIKDDGRKIYYVNDKLHRDDGPAIIDYTWGVRQWFRDNLRHREDGPAIEQDDGYKEWWINHQRHRLDGPAVEFANGSKEWWYKDKQINCSSQEEFERLIKLLPFI